ncbi:MAG: hypothetical protein U5K38_07415 [Woeseiaceae bacterium]|nr:hypothetical protein [Woeseiaceae bacterium]
MKTAFALPAATLSLAPVLLLFALGSARTAEAQEGASRVLDEVVVTARRREESLQDVPLAITAFSGEELAVSAPSTSLKSRSLHQT